MAFQKIKTNKDCLWFMMKKMNMTLHKMCAIVKEMSVYNENIHVHQASFSHGTASNKKKTKLTCVTEYMYEVKLFN